MHTNRGPKRAPAFRLLSHLQNLHAIPVELVDACNSRGQAGSRSTRMTYAGRARSRIPSQAEITVLP